MAFRISSHTHTGQRTDSVLIESSEATIAKSADSDFTFDLPDGASISIKESSNKLTISTQGAEAEVKGQKLKDSSLDIGTSAQFKCQGQEFYTTIVLSGEPTARKKSYLSTIALTLIWTLLAIQIIVPIWLPSKIKVHEVKGRNVLIENCSMGIDILRNNVKKTKSTMDKKSQIHRDIMARLSDEIEQIAWVFRNAGELMSQAELEQLEKDIKDYQKILKKIEKTNAVQVKPLSTDKAIKQILKSSK